MLNAECMPLAPVPELIDGAAVSGRQPGGLKLGSQCRHAVAPRQRKIAQSRQDYRPGPANGSSVRLDCCTAPFIRTITRTQPEIPEASPHPAVLALRPRALWTQTRCTAHRSCWPNAVPPSNSRQPPTAPAATGLNASSRVPRLSVAKPYPCMRHDMRSTSPPRSASCVV